MYSLCKYNTFTRVTSDTNKKILKHNKNANKNRVKKFSFTLICFMNIPFEFTVRPLHKYMYLIFLLSIHKYTLLLSLYLASLALALNNSFVLLTVLPLFLWPQKMHFLHFIVVT